jgi:hypothetical protein
MVVMVGGGAVVTILLSPVVLFVRIWVSIRMSVKSGCGGGGRIAVNRMSTWAMRFQNVENGGKANVQSNIETTKVEHGVMAGNRLSTWALQGEMAGNQMSTQAVRFQNVENGGKVNVQLSIETTKVEYGVMAGNQLSVRALQGDMAGNQMSTWAMRFINVENGGKANVQSSIETTKVEHGVMAGNWLSMRALHGDTAGNQMSTQAMR